MREMRATGKHGHLVLKVSRALLIGWIEKIVTNYNIEDQTKRSISKTFAKAGQDIFAHDEALFQKYLGKLNGEALYRALSDAQARILLEGEDAPAPVVALGAAPAPVAVAEENQGESDDDGDDQWKTCESCGKYRMMTLEWYERFTVCADLETTCAEDCDCLTPCDDFECPCSECVLR